MLRGLLLLLLEKFQGQNSRLVRISCRIREEWRGGTNLARTGGGYMCIHRDHIWAHGRLRWSCWSCWSRQVDRWRRWGWDMMMLMLMLMMFLQRSFVFVGIRRRGSPSTVHDVEQLCQGAERTTQVATLMKENRQSRWHGPPFEDCCTYFKTRVKLISALTTTIAHQETP
jgi:hypothetical protein